MFRKIFALVSLVLFLSGIIFYLYRFRQTKRPVSSALRAIPVTSAFILECRQPHELWKKISETNIMWEDLLSVKSVNRLNEQAIFFDSVYLNYPQVKEIFDKQPLFISAHITSAREFNFIFLFSVPPAVGSSAVNDIAKEIATFSPGFSQTEKEYDGALITTFYSSAESQSGVGGAASAALRVGNPSPLKGEGQGVRFSFTVYNDIFIGSSNSMLVEDAVKQMNSGSALPDDFAFIRAASTAGEKADCNFYVNHKIFPGFIELFTKKEFAGNIESLKNFADWTAIDLKLKPNILMFNGFTFSNDTLNKFLNLFEKQKPQEAEFTRVIPSNTALFVHFGFSNFNAFYKGLKSFPERNGNEEKINSINKECNCDIRKNLLSWIENEIAVVITEPSSTESFSPDFYAVFKSNNIAEAKKQLNQMADSSCESAADTTRFREHEIKKINISGIYSLLLGELFSNLQSNYFTVIGDYVVFGNEIQSLRNFISYYLSEKTLAKNLNYRSFSENLSSESNIFIYSNIARSANIFAWFAGAEYAKDIEENKELFRKFEAMSMQISSDNNNLFYNNIFLKYNPSWKQETSTLWEARLDTTVSAKPHLVTNHYTQAKEIFVQDDANNIYLISNTGKILWKKQLPEKIMSEIYQVDALKNNKLQILFNTTSFIYLIDRNGKDVHGFPVKLKYEATNGMVVFDYEQDKNYRMLVACADGRVYDFEKTGQPVTGWEFPKLKTEVKLPLQYFSLEGKDYIVAIDISGNVYVAERNGKSRINVKERIPVSVNNNFYIEKGKDIGKTRIVVTDSTGNITRLYFGGNMENIKINDFSSRHFFAYSDINNDKSGEYIFMAQNKLSVYAQDQLRYPVFNYEFDANITQPPMLFQFPDNSVRLGIADSESNKIYLFKENGTLQDNFPLYGTTPFSIGDINNDGELYLVTGSGNNIYTYLLK